MVSSDFQEIALVSLTGFQAQIEPLFIFNRSTFPYYTVPAPETKCVHEQKGFSYEVRILTTFWASDSF